jgi:hypothetical protein
MIFSYIKILLQSYKPILGKSAQNRGIMSKIGKLWAISKVYSVILIFFGQESASVDLIFRKSYEFVQGLKSLLGVLNPIFAICCRGFCGRSLNSGQPQSV